MPAAANRPATIADVARLAEVSTGTVSHVLSGRTGVRSETRSRVEAAIARLNYRPNAVARSLTQQRTRIIGMLVPDVSNPFFAELLVGVERRLEAAGYAVVFGNSLDSGVRQSSYATSFRERQVDGLVLVVAPDSELWELERIIDAVPCVLVDRALDGWVGDVVLGDDQAGMELAVDHLFQLGHRNFCLVNGDERLSTARRRGEGFRAALTRRGLDPTVISEGSFTIESGLAQARRLFDLVTGPVAVCAGNDLLALACITAAAERGLRVPGDVSLVGYDDITYARLVSPSLTTVRQPAGAMGEAAAALLLERLDGGRSEDRVVVMTPDLVVRRSTASAG